MNHLSDEDIQNYLDGNIPDRSASSEEHLQGCESCRNNLRAYQDLFTRLRDDQAIRLSEGFADSVLAEIPVKAPAKARFNYLNLFLAFLGILVCVGITMQYTDWENIGKTTVNSLLPDFDLQPHKTTVTEKRGSDKASTESLGKKKITLPDKSTLEEFEKYRLLIFGGIILGLVLLMDRMFFHKRYLKHRLIYLLCLNPNLMFH